MSAGVTVRHVQQHVDQVPARLIDARLTTVVTDAVTTVAVMTVAVMIVVVTTVAVRIVGETAVVSSGVTVTMGETEVENVDIVIAVTAGNDDAGTLTRMSLRL